MLSYEMLIITGISNKTTTDLTIIYINYCVDKSQYFTDMN